MSSENLHFSTGLTRNMAALGHTPEPAIVFA